MQLHSIQVRPTCGSATCTNLHATCSQQTTMTACYSLQLCRESSPKLRLHAAQSATQLDTQLCCSIAATGHLKMCVTAASTSSSLQAKALRICDGGQQPRAQHLLRLILWQQQHIEACAYRNHLHFMCMTFNVHLLVQSMGRILRTRSGFEAKRGRAQ